MAQRRSIRQTNGGYSLVELLAAVAIAGILAMITVPSYKGFVRKARMSSAKVELATLYKAEKIFFAEYETYTSRLDALGVQFDGNLIFDMGFDDDHLPPPPGAPPGDPNCLTVCSSPWCPTSRGGQCAPTASFGLEGDQLSRVTPTSFTAEAHAHFGEVTGLGPDAEAASFIVDEQRRIIEISPSK